jgi:photosystem II stability/assembly factor-like uncharacterized protein
VFRSGDGGSSWTATAAGPVGNVYALVVQGAEVLAGSDGGVFRSSDGGATWVLVGGGLPASPAHALLLDGGVLYAGTSSGAFESQDLGDSWSSAGDGLTNPRVLSLERTGTGALFAGTDGGSVFRRVASSPSEREPVFLRNPRGSPRLVPPRD